jgi:DNA repair exonuclease SbcCD ATPase subunit
MSNPTIGTIFHVDALKQRISAQIKVSKGNNCYGKLEVCNGN